MNNYEPFSTMAVKIDHNKESSFGGAFVIVPPEGAGEVVETLILDRQSDAIQFWKMLMEKAAATVTKLENEARNQSAFGVAKR